MGFEKYSVIVVFVLIVLADFGYAITASLGNARAIINVDLKEVPTIIERTVMVNNVNNESVKINVEVTDETKELVNIIDKEFRLNPGESKNAKYQVILKKPGNYEIRFSVTFTPDKGQPVGLSSVLIVKATSELDFPETEEELDNHISDNKDTDKSIDIDFVNRDTGNNNEITGQQTSKLNFEFDALTVIFLILIVLVSILGGYYFLKRS